MSNNSKDSSIALLNCNDIRFQDNDNSNEEYDINKLKIYIINHDMNTDSRFTMEKQLESFNVTNYDFFKARDKNNLDVMNDYNKYKAYSNFKDNISEIEILYNTINLFKYINNSINDDYVLILNDNVFLHNNFKNLFKFNIENKEVDLLLLGYNVYSFMYTQKLLSILKSKGPELVKINDYIDKNINFLGKYAYICSKKYRNIILEKGIKWYLDNNLHIDYGYKKLNYEMQEKLNYYIYGGEYLAVPNIVDTIINKKKYNNLSKLIDFNNYYNSIKYHTNKIIKNTNKMVDDKRVDTINNNLDDIIYDKSILGNFSNKLENKFIIFVPYCDIYNLYINDCIDSILMQDYKNYEIIIVNDGAENLNNIKKYIKLNNIKIINKKINKGPAYSKWCFIEYLHNNINDYNINDICIILDGDDKFINKDVLNIINNTYNIKKCWSTYGNAIGKFCDTINGNLFYKTDISRLRKENLWFFNHPRTFKIFTIFGLKEKDFCNNGEFLQKGTDRALYYHILEKCGHEKVYYIKEKLYYYRKHDNNSYKIYSNKKKENLYYISKLETRKKINEDIHIVMCLWKRIENLDKQLQSLNDISLNRIINIHLLNNNINNIGYLIKYVSKAINKYKNINIILSHYDNKYFGFQRFFYIRDVLLKKYILDYVIIQDDDQILTKENIKHFLKHKKPKYYMGWYTKKWSINNLDYWKGSIIDYKDLIKYNKNHIINVDYVGTGGCIIDVNIFLNNSILWNTIKNDNFSVYNIEDLWLSYICKVVYNWNLKRIFNKPILIYDKRKGVALFEKLHKEKQLFFNMITKDKTE